MKEDADLFKACFVKMAGKRSMTNIKTKDQI